MSNITYILGNIRKNIRSAYYNKAGDKILKDMEPYNELVKLVKRIAMLRDIAYGLKGDRCEFYGVSNFYFDEVRLAQNALLEELILEIVSGDKIKKLIKKSGACKYLNSKEKDYLEEVKREFLKGTNL